MTTETVSTRSTITRGALTAALLVLAALIVWLVLTRSVGDQRVILLLSALLPVVAAGLLFIRRAIGATLAVIARCSGLFLDFCCQSASCAPFSHH